MPGITRVRTAIKEDGASFGLWLGLPGTQLARSIANAASPGASFIIIDGEHGLIPLHGGVQETVMAIALSSASAPSPLVRITATQASDSTAWHIKLALDAGAHGVICPMVSTAAKAREIAAEARFPPIGRRGIGSQYCHEAWRLPRPQYISTANEHVLVLVQIETQAGVDNIDEILAVEGIDGVLIGPYDLSLSTGSRLPSPRPEAGVEKLIQTVKEACLRADKLAGIVTMSAADGLGRAKEGFRIVTIGSDTTVINQGFTSLFRAVEGSA